MRKTVLVDSYGWIEYFGGGKNAGKYAKYIEEANIRDYVTPSIVVYEVYKKVRSVYGRNKALEAVGHITYHTRVVDLSQGLCLAAAEISLSEGLGMADSMVLACARAENAVLVSGDEHFRGKEKVILIK